MSTFDFSTKELVETLAYTTMSQDRKRYTDVKIDGRQYRKFGTVQALTFVGNVYEDHRGRRAMCVGVAKQHPGDAKCDKQLAYEAAQMHAMVCPDLVMYTVPEHLTKYNFSKMMRWYEDMFDVEFIKTKKELENQGKCPQTYNR